MSKPAFTALFAASTKSIFIFWISAIVNASGVFSPILVAEELLVIQPPSSIVNGFMPSLGCLWLPFPPACHNWTAILAPCSCTNFTIGCHAWVCPSFHNPVSYKVLRPSAETAVHSVIIKPAPPTARLPKCTKCQLLGIPFLALYCCIGDNAILFLSSNALSFNGLNKFFILL